MIDPPIAGITCSCWRITWSGDPHPRIVTLRQNYCKYFEALTNFKFIFLINMVFNKVYLIIIIIIE